MQRLSAWSPVIHHAADTANTQLLAVPRLRPVPPWWSGRSSSASLSSSTAAAAAARRRRHRSDGDDRVSVVTQRGHAKVTVKSDYPYPLSDYDDMDVDNDSDGDCDVLRQVRRR